MSDLAADVSDRYSRLETRWLSEANAHLLEFLDFLVAQHPIFRRFESGRDLAFAKEQFRDPDAGLLFVKLLKILAAHGRAELIDGSVRIPSEAFTQAPRPIERLASAMAHVPAAERVHFELLSRVFDGWALLINEACFPEEILFPGFDFGLVERFYRQSPMYAYFNEITVAALRSIRARKGGPLRAIEFGTGTGSTSRLALVAAEPLFSELTLTDVSHQLLKRLKAEFGSPSSVKLSYEQVNLDRDQAAVGELDVAFAVNVLHATRDLSHSLAQARKCLRDGGILVLSEIAPQPGFANLLIEMSFGALPSFFQKHDQYRSETPLLGLKDWAKVLEAEGWVDVEAYPRIELEKPYWGGVLCAKKG